MNNLIDNAQNFIADSVDYLKDVATSRDGTGRLFKLIGSAIPLIQTGFGVVVPDPLKDVCKTVKEFEYIFALPATLKPFFNTKSSISLQLPPGTDPILKTKIAWESVFSGVGLLLNVETFAKKFGLISEGFFTPYAVQLSSKQIPFLGKYGLTVGSIPGFGSLKIGAIKDPFMFISLGITNLKLLLDGKEWDREKKLKFLGNAGKLSLIVSAPFWAGAGGRGQLAFDLINVSTNLIGLVSWWPKWKREQQQ